MLTLRRARRPLVILCLAAVALAVFVPGAAVVDLATPPPDSILLPQLEPLDTVTAVPLVSNSRTPSAPRSPSAPLPSPRELLSGRV